MSAAPVLQKVHKFSINVGAGPHRGRVFTFDRPTVLIGRDPECDLALSEDVKVSRRHVEISIQGQKLLIQNKSGKNFMLVNEEKVDTFEVIDTATLQVGESILEIRIDKPKPAGRPNELMNSSGGHLSSVPTGMAAGNVARSRGSSAPPRRPPSAQSFLDNPRARFYGLILFIGLIGWYLLSSTGPTKEPPPPIRSEQDVLKSIEDSQKAVKDLLTEQQKTGQNSLQFKTAQEHYMRGFRDYRQGQYARAMQSFQAALSFFPNHELARTYWTISKRKFDERVQFEMMQGQRYLGKHNYRMCKASFQNAMAMLKDETDKNYKEAKQKAQECDLRLSGGR